MRWDHRDYTDQVWNWSLTVRRKITLSSVNKKKWTSAWKENYASTFVTLEEAEKHEWMNEFRRFSVSFLIKELHIVRRNYVKCKFIPTFSFYNIGMFLTFSIRARLSFLSTFSTRCLCARLPPPYFLLPRPDPPFFSSFSSPDPISFSLSVWPRKMESSSGLFQAGVSTLPDPRWNMSAGRVSQFEEIWIRVLVAGGLWTSPGIHWEVILVHHGLAESRNLSYTILRRTSSAALFVKLFPRMCHSVGNLDSI